MLIDHVAAEFPHPMPNALARGMLTDRYANVPGTVREMVAHNRPVLPSSVDDLDERIRRFALVRVRMSSYPGIHLSNVPRRQVGTEKLMPILTPALRHQFRLTLYGSPAAGNPNMRVRELVLHPRNECVDVGRRRLVGRMQGNSALCLISAMTMLPAGGMNRFG